MPSNSKLFYWDACIFLAWLKNEERSEGEMEGLTRLVEEVEKNKYPVITSVITITEILPKRSGKEVVAKFRKLFQRSNFRMINIDERIATKASKIRDHYLEKAKKEKINSIKLGDGIHLATAIIYNVSEFHTFDGSHKKPGLLGLNGDVAGYPLVIEKPNSNQITFDGELLT